MMTPQERTEKLIAEIQKYCIVSVKDDLPDDVGNKSLISVVEQAISEAVRDERKVCQELATEAANNAIVLDKREAAGLGLMLAMRIRERGE
jgi:hypothetical protein